MDPNITLAEIRELIKEGKEGSDFESDHELLVDLIHALDTWLSAGGMLPRAWSLEATTVLDTWKES